MQNINLGLLGHVDSGKTSLAKTLSTIGSTASFDRHPQSQQRGITIDLGFSSFQLNDSHQVTLVDCPGHSSLIRTVIGGIQIIDGIILVVDATQGLQHQTSECLLLAKIFNKPLIVAMNKWDLLHCDEKVSKMKETICRYLKNELIEFVPTSATTLAGIQALKERLADFCLRLTNQGIEDIVPAIAGMRIQSEGHQQAHAIFMVDHLFGLKGQGTVATGTLLSGQLSVDDLLEMPDTKEQKRIKSIHVFKTPQLVIKAGDRAGLCIAGIEPTRFPSERLVLGSAGSVVRQINWVHCTFTAIPHFKHSINSNSKYHIIVGHEMTLGTVYLLFNTDRNEHYLENQTELAQSSALIKLDSAISIPNPLLLPVHILTSKLDIDLSRQRAGNECRFAFYGTVLSAGKSNEYAQFVNSLNIVQWKQKMGSIDRIIETEKAVLVKNLSIPSHLGSPIGLAIEFENGTVGQIVSFFGQNRRLKVSVDNVRGLTRESVATLKYKRQITFLP